MSPRKPASTPEPESTGSDKPVSRVQYGTVSAAVFSQQRERTDGEEFTDYTISLRRSYRDKEGQWQNNSITFFRREVLAAAQALIEAYKESYRLGAQDRAEADSSEG
jgi:hypothetical protein